MQNFKEIIEKLKDILSTDGAIKLTDKQLAKELNISYDAYRKQKQRNNIPHWEIMQFLAKRNISINYFFFNQSPESLIESTNRYVLLKYSNLNASTGAGTFNYIIEEQDLIIDKHIINYLNTSPKHTKIIQALGDSMYPQVEDKALVFVDTSNTTIKKKNIYLIQTVDSLFIKRIKKIQDTYYMCSVNQEYQDVELEEFKVLGRVTGVLNKF